MLIWIVAIVPVCSAETLDTQKETRANLKFVEMKYEHIDYKEIEGMLDKLKEIDESEEEEIYRWNEEFFNLYYKINTMIQISKLKYQLYNDQSHYFEEYLYSVDLLGKMKSAYLEVFEDETDSTKGLSSDMSKYYELNIERSKLIDEYTSKQSNVAIDVEGKKMKLVDIIEDSSLDDKSFAKLYNEWYDTYNHEVGEILLKLVKIDNQLVKIKGCKTYAEYAYSGYSRDYTPEDTKVFIANVKKYVPEIFKKLYMSNMAADYILQKYTYKDQNELLKNIEENLISHYDQLKKAYDYMVKYELFDIETRSNKETGGFTTYFEEYLEPFMVLNYQKKYETALTFIHEFGHFYAYYQIGANEGGLDLDETYSQAMELLAMPYYGSIFKDEKFSNAAKVFTIESLLGAIIQGCLYEEFLNEIYQNPNITVDEMNELYGRLAKGYGLSVDNRSWCTVTHNFEMPYYYISYSVSAVAAFEIWNESLVDMDKGIDTYFKLIEAGRDHSFIESLETLGLKNPLKSEVLEEIMTSVDKYFSVDKKAKQAA